MTKFRSLVRGFTLVELMIVVAIIGILSSVAIPAFMKYIRRSKTTEATMNLRKLFDSTVSYIQTEHANATGQILARQFPVTQAWTPTQGACCPMTGQKCAPAPSYWATPTWMALNFGVDDPFYYSYQNSVVTGTGAAAGDLTNLEASSDLNCNAVFSLYRRSAGIDTQFNVYGGSGLFIANDLE